MMYRFLMTQMKNRKPKDWISTVLKDLSDLNMDVSLENLKIKKKSFLKKLLSKLMKEKAFEELERKKESHSKVMFVKHRKLEMQKYLRPTENKIMQEEAQEIFKLRSRVSDVKINFRGKYENFECEICMEEDETQKHIIYCKEINKKNENYIKLPEYEEIYNGNVNSQIMIAKRFMENVKIREKLKEA